MEFIASHNQLGDGMKKPEKIINKNSPEFLQARAERIEKRRARISAKVAKEKGTLNIENDSTPSSLDFLNSIGAVSVSRKNDSNKGGFGGQSSKSAGGKSEGAGAGKVDYADSALDTQMEESRQQLEQIILDGETLITNVKVAAEFREKTRHDHADESRKERLDRLEQEAAESQEMYESINEHWMASAEKLLPMEFYAKIQEQKKACDDLLEKQDDEIYNLKRELEDQDIEYENNLEMYQKDIMLMGDRIDDNVDTLRNAFMEELELIEEYTVQDREQLLEENQKEWMSLLKEYEELEKSSLEERKNEALNKFEKLTDLYGNVKQEARLLKNRMLTDMRTLFVEREKVKCAIQLNLEKLDYNLAVLRKREEENMRMKNSMKRLLLKLQDRFNAKSTILHDTVSKGKKNSEKLIRDIRRLESLCDDAQRKTLHIYASDYHKFMDLWILNEEECREKLCRLLGSERYIVEEQLGTGFLEPDILKLENRPKEVQCFLDKVNCCGGPDIRMDPFQTRNKVTVTSSGYPGGFAMHNNMSKKSKSAMSPGGTGTGPGNNRKSTGEKPMAGFKNSVENIPTSPDGSGSKKRHSSDTGHAGTGGRDSRKASDYDDDQAEHEEVHVEMEEADDMDLSQSPPHKPEQHKQLKKISEAGTETGTGTGRTGRRNERRGLSFEEMEAKDKDSKNVRGENSSSEAFFDKLRSVRALKKHLDAKEALSQDKWGTYKSEEPSAVPSAMSFLQLTAPDEQLKERSETSLLVDPASEFDFCPGPEPDPEIQRRLMKHITRVVCDQTGFLLEDKLRKIMLPLIDAERNLIHIDTVLQVLGVKHVSEMQILARYLLKYSSIMKGIISKAGFHEPSQERMFISAGGMSDENRDPEDSAGAGAGEECPEVSSGDDVVRKVNRLQQENRLSPSSSEVEEGDEGGPPLGPTPSSALDVINQSIFDNITGIDVVHGVGTVPQGKIIQRKLKLTGSPVEDEDGEKDKSDTIFRVIEEFSSDESLGAVLQQVEAYGKKIKEGTLKAAICPAVVEDSSSSCSCESFPDRATSPSTSSRADTDDGLGSNKATVLSWVTGVAAGLTSDCKSAPGEEDESYIEEIGEGEDESDHVTGATATTAGPPGPGPGPGPGTCLQETPKKGQTPEEVLLDQEFDRYTSTPARTSCAVSEQSGPEFMSGGSLPTTAVGSTEFFYIEPNDVLRALAAFCRDHKSKAKSEIPTKAQLCESRISKICFPSQLAIKQYWNLFLLLLDPKSKILWDGIMDVFKDFYDNLKARNEYVEDIVKYYKQNYELSHLLKKHIMTGASLCGRNQVGPFNRDEIPYCEFPCSANPRENRPQFNYPPCSRPRPPLPTPIDLRRPDFECNE